MRRLQSPFADGVGVGGVSAVPAVSAPAVNRGGRHPRFVGGRETRICRSCRRETAEFRCPTCKQPTERTIVYNGSR